LLIVYRENLVNENLRKQNMKGRPTDYAINQKVQKKQIKTNKLGARTSSLYNTTQVHAKDTFTIPIREGITEHINTRQIIP
jgi:hypothetical protein